MKTQFIILIFFTGIFFFSCKKEKGESSAGDGKIEFYFSHQKISLKSTNTGLYCKSICISIKDASNIVVYNSKVINLMKTGEGYTSEPIELEAGNYSLTKFLVLDSAGNAIYATPVAGSPNAGLVEHPLSIDFTVQKDVVTNLILEVLSTDGFIPSDFGYPSLTFNILKKKSLIAYYPFELNARDKSGNDYNGFVFGGVTYDTDRFGKLDSACVFNGNGNYIILSNDFDIPEKTINLWFNCYSFLTGQDNDINSIYTSDSHNLLYGADYFYIRKVAGNVRLYFLVCTGTIGTQNLDSADFTYNTWVNPCITIDQNYVKYYLNGALINTIPNYGIYYHSTEGIDNVILGSNREGTDSYYYGSIDDIRIYNFALNDQQVDSIYNNLIPVFK